MAKTKELLQDIRKLLMQEEFSDEDLKKLGDLKENFNENIEGMVEMIYSFAGLETEAKIIKENAMAREKFYKNQQERIKSAISFFMHQVGKEKLDTGAVRIAFRASEVLVIKEGYEVPDVFCRIKTTTTKDPDKDMIKEAIRIGEDIEFAYLDQKNNIQIK